MTERTHLPHRRPCVRYEFEHNGFPYKAVIGFRPDSMIQSVQARYYSAINGCVETIDYFRREDIDPTLVDAHAGIAAVLPSTFAGEYFDISDNGEPACIIEAYAEDGETVCDLVSWRIAHPEAFFRAIGAAPLLGWTQVTNPASWCFSTLLRVHRTPLSWLKAACSGVVVLDHRYGPAALGQALGPLLAEDAEHAVELRKLLCRAPVTPDQIVFPRAHHIQEQRADLARKNQAAGMTAASAKAA